MPVVGLSCTPDCPNRPISAIRSDFRENSDTQPPAIALTPPLESWVSWFSPYSQMLISVVLAGDSRLTQRLGRDELLPLGSRIRIRLNTEYADTEQLMAALRHLLETAGNPQLMTEGLMTTLVEHAAGNYRVLTTLAAELLATAARTQRETLDEKLYFDCFSNTPKRQRRSA